MNRIERRCSKIMPPAVEPEKCESRTTDANAAHGIRGKLLRPKARFPEICRLGTRNAAVAKLLHFARPLAWQPLFRGASEISSGGYSCFKATIGSRPSARLAGR